MARVSVGFAPVQRCIRIIESHRNPCQPNGGRHITHALLISVQKALRRNYGAGCRVWNSIGSCIRSVFPA
eukprot:10867698-Lingulodinium_polyedra.AAC.1